MSVSPSRLPWNDKPVQSVLNLHEYITRLIPAHLHHYLPKRISLFFDEVVPRREIVEFVTRLASFLKEETGVWSKRLTRAVDLDLLSMSEIMAFLANPQHVQPWLLYYSAEGGFGDCKTVRHSNGAWGGLSQAFNHKNHGIAWRKSKSNTYSCWLATSIRSERMWDWDVDIGHEVCHATFAPVPVFQRLGEMELPPQNSDETRLGSDSACRRLASVCYMCSELAVVAVRGEGPEARTGFSALEAGEPFDTFLGLSNRLMPGLGFAAALESYLQLGDDIQIHDGLLRIGAPALKAILALAPGVVQFCPPTRSMFQAAIKRRKTYLSSVGGQLK